MNEWSKWITDENNRKRVRVKLDMIDDIKVSTVFIGIDAARIWFNNATPMLFETLISKPGRHPMIKRYATYDEAVKGHEETVNYIKEVP
jgi:hypothetical protein